MEKLLDIVDQLDIAIPNRGYWYLRTEGGVFYDEFKDNGYIAINYNYIHPSAIQLNNLDHLRRLITTNDPKFENKDYESLEQGRKSTVGKYIGILRNFNGMNRGDIIVIPSADSDRFCLGTITDNQIYLPEESDTVNCNFLLRRRVRWEKIDAHIPEYSPILYSLKHSHLALTKIEKYSEYLNAILRPLFFQNNRYYFTLNVNKEEDIPLVDLKNLLDSYYNILTILNNAYGFNEDVDKAVVKLNLNSKGKLNLIQEKTVNSTRSLAAASVLLALFSTSCTQTDLSSKTDLDDEIVKELKEEIDTYNSAKHKLQIPDDSI